MSAHDRRVALWLFLAALALYALSAGGHFYSSDDAQKLAVLDALFRHGTLSVADGWARGLDGRYYAWFPLGASLVMLPGYLGGLLATWLVPQLPSDYMIRFCVSFENSLVSAALVTGVYWVARRLGQARDAALVAALALGLGTMVWPYAKTSWSEPVATLLVAGGLWALLAARPRAGLAGVLLAAATLVRLELALVAVAAFVWLAVDQRGDRRLLGTFAAPCLLALGLTLAYDQLRLGTPLGFPSYRLPQHELGPGGRLARSVENLYQYTVSPNQGTLWYSPAIWGGLLGWRRFRREQPRAAGLILVTLTPLLVFYVVGWGPSSWAWGLRYSYLFLPALVLPIAWVWRDGGRATRAALGGLVVVGALVQALGVLNDPVTLYERALAARPVLTIQGIMHRPETAALKLAAEATPRALQGGAALLAGADPLPPPTEARRRRERLPDLWWILAMLAGVPRRAIALGALVGLILFAVSVRHLGAALRQAP